MIRQPVAEGFFSVTPCLLFIGNLPRCCQGNLQGVVANFQAGPPIRSTLSGDPAAPLSAGEDQRYQVKGPSCSFVTCHSFKFAELNDMTKTAPSLPRA